MEDNKEGKVGASRKAGSKSRPSDGDAQTHFFAFMLDGQSMWLMLNRLERWIKGREVGLWRPTPWVLEISGDVIDLQT